MKNWPYAGKTFISKEGLAQEYRLREQGFEIRICHMNEQEEKELIHKFIHLFPGRRAISELS
jgi:hypothetical protein